ncbi:response regulator transcription factor [Chromobacterium vaccinii]|uniref:response regulator transcription factor n=1 Tax=Chromobacterium vaccinii TaxID=1108595 RepID=UPI000E16540B|nr:response regulator transcription factor [Chromobacterium vaccinii]SUX55400.1 Capsular synthesis regulator component B [Chromobacterium vaccinii]
MDRIKIMLLDDHDVVRAGLLSFLQHLEDVEVLGSFGRTVDLVAGMREQAPGLVLLDFSLGKGEMDGLLLIQSISARFPSCRILVISAFDVPAARTILQKAGAHGFIKKSATSMEIIKAIRVISYGYPYWSTSEPCESEQEVTLEKIDFQVVPLLNKLSPREREVIRCYLDGMTISEIAEKFARSAKTISTQKHSAFEKMGIKTDRELFMLKNEIASMNF